MGHLYAFVTVVFFVVLMAAKIYLSYLYAARHPRTWGQSPREIAAEGVRFRPRRGLIVFLIAASVAVPAIFVAGIAKAYKPSEPVRMTLFWYLVDLSLPATIIMVAGALQGVRQYVHIYPHGFVYKKILCARRYSGNDIRGVCSSEKFIFINIRGRRLPLMLDNIYGAKDVVPQLLAALALSKV